MKWMRKAEVARAAEVAESTVTRYADKGVIPSTRDAHGWRLYPPEAPRLIREHMAKHGGPGGRPLARD